MQTAVATVPRPGASRHGDLARAAAALLTPREREVVEMAARGLSNRQIAEHLVLSPRTVGAHLYRAFPKLGVGRRAALRDALTALEARSGPR